MYISMCICIYGLFAKLYCVVQIDDIFWYALPLAVEIRVKYFMNVKSFVLFFFHWFMSDGYACILRLNAVRQWKHVNFSTGNLNNDAEGYSK